MVFYSIPTHTLILKAFSLPLSVIGHVITKIANPKENIKYGPYEG